MGSFGFRSIRVAISAMAVLTSPLAAAVDDGPTWVGSGSCAAKACHGGRREPLGLKGSEYSFWAAYDPHNRAFSALHDDRSLRIERNLKGLADPESARPYENALCLKCHAQQGFEPGRPRSNEFTLADGVGCEACHGPASSYLAPHSEAGWSGLSDRGKAEGFGLRATKDLLERGRICAECHVGRGDADVNHDLIAAGHPRLNFEFGGHLAKLPKHWRAEDDRARNPDYEARAWALGQVLAARAALELLESRALRALPAESPGPWPEFAESRCFSCHQGLASALRPGGGRPGPAPWSTWYLPGPGSATATLLGTDMASLAPLRDLMARPEADPAVVARRARAAADDLGRRAEALNRGRIRPGQVRDFLLAALRDDSEGDPLDWDRAAQRYLAIVALAKEAGSGPSPSRARTGLGRMLADLDLPALDRSTGGIYDSPRHFDPARFRNDLRAVREALSTP